MTADARTVSQWIDELPGEGSHPTVPGSWRAGKDEPLSAARRCNVSGVAPAEPRVDAGTLQRAYSAHNALVRSLVPWSRLLDIDITAISAEEAWARVARFLTRKIPEDACLAPLPVPRAPPSRAEASSGQFDERF